MVTTQPSVDDDWIKVDGNIVNKDNIDSYIPNFSTDSARVELENLQAIQNKINETKGSWEDYNDSFQGGRKYLLDYAKSNDVLKSSVDNVKQANQQARASALAHNEALKQQTLGAKAASFALKGLAVVGNVLATMLISWAIGKVVEVKSEKAMHYCTAFHHQIKSNYPKNRMFLLLEV